MGQSPEELSVEERNLLSVAYKNAVGSRRAAWRIITSVEQKEKTKGNADNAAYAKEYCKKVENELHDICGKILKLLDDNLITKATTGTLQSSLMATRRTRRQRMHARHTLRRRRLQR